MKVTRLYTGADGQSHFEDIEVEIGKLVPGEGIVFRHAPPGNVQGWHPAPRRQYVITLSGEGEIETSDGTKRRFGPGAMMLADDTTGRGHITRVVSSVPRVYVMIPVK
jgi:quercetin dioxygenase-like cupin family protein